jgi:Protein of unknown function (DUF4232)
VRRVSALILPAAALLIAACGGSSNSGAGTPGATQTSPQAAAQTATSAPAPTSSSPTTTASTTPSATPGTGSSRCRAGDLTGAFLGGQAATGHGLLGFALRNLSGHTCVALGYPGVQFLSQGGQALPTIPTHTRQDFFGPLSNHPLAVAPGASISFRLGVTHGAASTTGCATAYALQVIPPNDTATLRIAIPNGAYECQTTTVSPMQPGDSAYP